MGGLTQQTANEPNTFEAHSETEVTDGIMSCAWFQ